MIFGVTWATLVALGLSLFTFGAQITSWVRNRARLAVNFRGQGFAYAEPSGEMLEQVDFTIVVQNIGKLAQTVFDVGVEDRRKDGESAISVRESRFFNEKLDEMSSTMGIGPNPVTVSGPELPHQLAVGGVAEWRLLDGATRLHDHNAEWRPFAVRLRPRKGDKAEKLTRSKDFESRTTFFAD